MLHMTFFSQMARQLKQMTCIALVFLGSHSWAGALPSSAISNTTPENNQVMPSNIPKPLKINVSLILNNLISLDEKSGTFEADVDLTLSWNDPNLAFDPKVMGTTVMNFNVNEAPQKLKSIWTPHISISNIEKIISNVPSLSIDREGTAVYAQRIKAGFKIHPSLKAFPFDKQSLTFYLDASQNTLNEVKFTQDQQAINHSGVREGVRLSGWKMQDIDFKHSLVRNQTGGFYPRFEAKISMTRISAPHLLAFAPLFLIMLAPTILSLYSDASTLAVRLSAWGAALLTLIATTFALNQKYPALESDSILPEVTSIVLIYQFLMILLTMTFLNPAFVKHFKNPFIVPEILRYLRWMIPLGFILLIVSRILLVTSQG